MTLVRFTAPQLAKVCGGNAPLKQNSVGADPPPSNPGLPHMHVTKITSIGVLLLLLANTEVQAIG